MIEMRDNDPKTNEMTKTIKDMQKRRGIWTSGDTDDHHITAHNEPLGRYRMMDFTKEGNRIID